MNEAVKGGFTPSDGKNCSGCCHRRSLSGKTACFYILDVGKSRGCSVSECPYYEHNEKKKAAYAKAERQLSGGRACF